MCQLPGDQTPRESHLDNETVGQDEQHQLLQQQEEVEDPIELHVAEEGR